MALLNFGNGRSQWYSFTEALERTLRTVEVEEPILTDSRSALGIPRQCLLSTVPTPKALGNALRRLQAKLLQPPSDLDDARASCFQCPICFVFLATAHDMVTHITVPAHDPHSCRIMNLSRWALEKAIREKRGVTYSNGLLALENPFAGPTRARPLDLSLLAHPAGIIPRYLCRQKEIWSCPFCWLSFGCDACLWLHLTRRQQKCLRSSPRELLPLTLIPKPQLFVTYNASFTLLTDNHSRDLHIDDKAGIYCSEHESFPALRARFHWYRLVKCLSISIARHRHDCCHLVYRLAQSCHNPECWEQLASMLRPALCFVPSLTAITADAAQLALLASEERRSNPSCAISTCSRVPRYFCTHCHVYLCPMHTQHTLAQFCLALSQVGIEAICRTCNTNLFCYDARTQMFICVSCAVYTKDVLTHLRLKH